MSGVPSPVIDARGARQWCAHCPLGCKVYADPKSGVRVKAHNANYGCRR